MGLELGFAVQRGLQQHLIQALRSSDSPENLHFNKIPWEGRRKVLMS